nr:alcohol dehydrogenase catalytic domain-containing protein [Nitrosomonas sp.]
MTRCSFVPSHEIVGTISAKGNSSHNLQLGQRVGALVGMPDIA